MGFSLFFSHIRSKQLRFPTQSRRQKVFFCGDRYLEWQIHATEANCVFLVREIRNVQDGASKIQVINTLIYIISLYFS